MIKVAIVEDDVNSEKKLTSFLKKYGIEKKVIFEIFTFTDGQVFVNSLLFEDESYDLLFLDIELPGLNGIEVAKKFREVNKTAVLIFTTIMNQYAIHGYVVDAMDYIVKPIDYLTISSKLDKAVRIIEKNVSLLKLKVIGGGLSDLKHQALFILKHLITAVFFIPKTENINNTTPFLL